MSEVRKKRGGPPRINDTFIRLPLTYELLSRAERAARKQQIKRVAWIRQAMAKALEETDHRVRA